ncbi:MAG: hypothetical protein NC432_02440 [Roseburia sp.]|nr:hypothetical protein [Roseburia sp.]MCM1097449.1 hypothetical protein [Ruminococcus flavefaciens]
MIHNEKKLANIVEELTMYFFAMEAADIRSSIQVEDRRARIEFDADYRPEYEDRLPSLEKYLKAPKNEALGDFYWELAGTGDPGEASQLLVVGSMVDEAEIRIEDGRVHIKLYKELDR